MIRSIIKRQINALKYPKFFSYFHQTWLLTFLSWKAHYTLEIQIDLVESVQAGWSKIFGLEEKAIFFFFFFLGGGSMKQIIKRGFLKSNLEYNF